MTYAPPALLDAREYLLSELDITPGRLPSDLDGDEVGIVAAGHGDSYHRGRGYVGDGSYSVRESPRDARGLTGASSALDIGEFSVRRGGRLLTLRDMAGWLVAECARGAPDTLDIREVIYSLDGQTVRRWDRLGVRESGDRSHLRHMHISRFRDAEHKQFVSLFRRYIEGGDAMALLEEEQWREIRYVTHMVYLILTGEETMGGARLTEKFVTPPREVTISRHIADIRAGVTELRERPGVTVDAGEVARALVADPEFVRVLTSGIAADLAARLQQ